MIVRHCPCCRDEREFDRPPCIDGHDADCPELACSQCGTALLIGAGAEVPEILAASAA